MHDPFLVRAIVAGLGLAIVAAPLGCLVVWNRMAYFGETVAQASLIGVVLALVLQVEITLGVLIVTVAVAGLLILLQQQKLVPMDSLLGLTHHAALALGAVAMRQVQGPSVDLIGYLFGEILFVTWTDVVWIYAGGAIVLTAISRLWQPLLRMSVHEELARAEGIGSGWVRGLFTLLLALTIAVAIKIIGILLAIAFLIVPVVAARPLAATPERMVGLTALIGCISVLIGILLSYHIDNMPSGAAIVLVMSLLAAVSLAVAGWRSR